MNTYHNGVCIECDGPQAEHKTTTESVQEGSTLVVRRSTTHPRIQTHELRQYGNILRIAADQPLTKIIGDAIEFTTRGLSETTERLGVQPFRPAWINVVPPGGHDDPLAEEWAFAWKAQYLVSFSADDKGLPRL